MAYVRRILGLVAGLAVLETVCAGLDLSSNSTVAVYWGQNSFRGSGDLAQQRLGYYCDDSNIDVIILSFLMTVNGPGGAPEIDFASSSEKCETFSGTNLKNCPEIGTDIKNCQSKDKTILLSIGGATYSEGGFSSPSAADAGAELLWATFGPDQGSSSKAHRPFGDAVIDGFDFDFEAAVTNMGKFATKLRSLADQDTSKKYFLTAAPQCPFPDAADKDILNTDSSAAIDAVFVQFYNNYCGVNAFTPARKVAGGAGAQTRAQNSFNFDVWDKWALTESKNKDVRVFLGVPANTGAASTGYVPIGSLEPVIAYSKGFESFGGVMMWDVTQAYGNQGFLDGVHKALGKGSGQHGAQGQPTAKPATSSTKPAASSATHATSSAKPVLSSTTHAVSATPAASSKPAVHLLTHATASPASEPPQPQQQEQQQQQEEPKDEEEEGEEYEDDNEEEEEGEEGEEEEEEDEEEEAPQSESEPAEQHGPQQSATQDDEESPGDSGEQQQKQEQSNHLHQPLNLLPSPMEPGDDLDWIEI
ncbi:glycoside hydrolase superfamily [Aspergillus varians]